MAKKKTYGENEIKRTTAIDKRKNEMTIKKMEKQKDTFRFDLAEQRGLVWKPEQQSLFIHSLMYGFPFPPAFALQTEDGFTWFLDGKQRISSVLSYLEDGFALHKSTPDVFGYKVAGKKFSQLPEQFQDTIYDEQFLIYEMQNMTDEEISTMFQRLNNGAPLTKLEVTRSMYTKLFSEVQDISEQEFFTNYISLTQSAIDRFVNQELVIQIAMLLDSEYHLKGFGGNHIREYILGLKSKEGTFTPEMMDTFKKMDTYLSMALNDFDKKEISKAMKKSNVPMVFMTGIKAKEAGMKPEQFGEFVRWFLIENYSSESNYGEASQSGSAKKENVLIRLNEIDKGFKKYLEKNPVDKWVAKPKAVEVPEASDVPEGQTSLDVDGATTKPEAPKADDKSGKKPEVNKNAKPENKAKPAPKPEANKESKKGETVTA